MIWSLKMDGDKVITGTGKDRLVAKLLSEIWDRPPVTKPLHIHIEIQPEAANPVKP